MITTCGTSIFIAYLAIFAELIAADPVQGGQFADVPDQEWTQVISLARDGWKSLRQPTSAFRADVSVDNTFVEDGKQRPWPFQYLLNHGDHCGLLQMITPTHSEIFGSNRDYAFRLFKNDDPLN